MKDSAKFCSSCGALTNSAPMPQPQATAESPSHWAHSEVARSEAVGKSVTKRYTDAYKLAGAVVGIGKAIKIIGGILGVIIGLVFIGLGGAMSQLGGTTGRNEGAALIVFVVGLLYGGLVFLLFYVVAVIVSAQGQILRAGLDTAVHTSPFVGNDEKVRILSLI